MARSGCTAIGFEIRSGRFLQRKARSLDEEGCIACYLAPQKNWGPLQSDASSAFLPIDKSEEEFLFRARMDGFLREFTEALDGQPHLIEIDFARVTLRQVPLKLFLIEGRERAFEVVGEEFDRLLAGQSLE